MLSPAGYVEEKMSKTGPPLRLFQTVQHLGEGEVAGNRWEVERSQQAGGVYKCGRMEMAKLSNQEMRVQVLAVSLNLSKELNLFGPRFPHP